MKIQIDDIREQETEIAFAEPVEELNRLLGEPAEAEFQLAGPLHVSAAHSKNGGEILVRGRFDAQVKSRCARCAETFTLPLEGDFTRLFRPADGLEERGETADATVVAYRGEQIDLSPHVREELLVALPTQPICRADCAGLCPQCGANRNQTECACREQWVDPRLDVLRNWKAPH